jgi:hypothetical protein
MLTEPNSAGETGRARTTNGSLATELFGPSFTATLLPH